MNNPLKIALTTDFTESSHQAINFATRMFDQWKGEIIYFLLHGFTAMVPHVDTGSVPVITNRTLEIESREQLKTEAETIRKKTKINVQTVFEIGTITDVVKKIEEKENPDLIIMASRKKSFFERVTFGSNTFQVMSSATTPLMLIPLEADFRKLEKIVFAADFEPLEIPYESFKLFKDLVTMFNTKLQVLRVYESEEQMKGGSTLQNSTIHKYLENLDHEHFPVVNSDIDEGIISFIDQNDPDMIVMIPRNKNFIEKIFKSSVTRHLVNKANIPLLILK